MTILPWSARVFVTISLDIFPNTYRFPAGPSTMGRDWHNPNKHGTNTARPGYHRARACAAHSAHGLARARHGNWADMMRPAKFPPLDDLRSVKAVGCSIYIGILTLTPLFPNHRCTAPPPVLPSTPSSSTIFLPQPLNSNTPWPAVWAPSARRPGGSDARLPQQLHLYSPSLAPFSALSVLAATALPPVARPCSGRKSSSVP